MKSSLVVRTIFLVSIFLMIMQNDALSDDPCLVQIGHHSNALMFMATLLLTIVSTFCLEWALVPTVQKEHLSPSDRRPAQASLNP